jgi:Bacterial regulatory proteins, gntR family
VTAFAAIPKVDLAAAAVGQIRDAILSGDIAAGEELPSERQLALLLGINRTTVREVLTHLELLGIIDRLHPRHPPRPGHLASSGPERLLSGLRGLALGVDGVAVGVDVDVGVCFLHDRRLQLPVRMGRRDNLHRPDRQLPAKSTA